MKIAWIESHQELARHPKTKRFARVLDISLPAAVGHLHFFWWWAMDYAQDGDLSRYDKHDIADACGWEDDAGKIFNALSESGFVDMDEQGMSIHDWFDYAGRLIEKKEQNKERKRRSRANKTDRNKSNEDVTRTSHGQTSDEHEGHRATKPNLTKPNHIDVVVVDVREENQNFGKAYSVMEEYFGLTINAIQSEKLGEYIDDGLEPDVVEEAAHATREKGKGIDYCWGILDNCMQKGIKTVTAFREDREQFEARRLRRDQDRGQHDAGETNGKNGGSQGKETGYGYYDQFPGLVQSL